MKNTLPCEHEVQRRTITCPCCDSKNLNAFYKARNVPINIGTLWETIDEATSCAVGDIVLELCQDCGLIVNTAFDPNKIDYSHPYDNSLDGSVVFQEYAENLAKRLVASHDLRGKRIAEIGCGNGKFLALLCRMGNNSGIGYDPGHDPASASESLPSDVVVLPKNFDIHSKGADFICCRHVLEHIADPLPFLQEIHRIALKQTAPVYFEVPNALDALQQVSIGTLIYEHCVYYCPKTIRRVFERAGYEVQNVSVGFSSQFLGIEARATSAKASLPTAAPIDEIMDAVERFRIEWDVKQRALQEVLSVERDRGNEIVIWGAGARTVSVLNSLEDTSMIHSIVDINPNKHGKYLAGTGHQIISPERLPAVKPALTVVMNEIYSDEISKALTSMGIKSRLWVA